MAPRPRSRTPARLRRILCCAQYRSQFRLAVLLTGDADAASPRIRCPCRAISQYQPRISTS
jgi:hypothetical protein